MELTESFAMFPGAAVSGFYFAHPEAKYFVVGKIGEDQLKCFRTRAARSHGHGYTRKTPPPTAVPPTVV